MSPSRNRSSCFTFRLAIAMLAAELNVPQALADPLYTITNLGAGPITLSTAGGGSIAVPSGEVTPGLLQLGTYASSEIVSVSNGQASYAFPTTPDTVLGSTGASTLPSTYPPPDSNNLLTQFYTGALINSSGTAVVNGWEHYSPYATASVAYSIQQNPNGTWGQPTLITEGPLRYDTDYASGGYYITAAGLNKEGQALLSTSYPNVPYNTLLYNTNSHTLTDLETLSAIVNGPYTNFVPIAIDDQGRILVREGPGDGGTVDTLLFTPDGVSTNPLSTPEPGALAVWVVISACLVARFVSRRSSYHRMLPIIQSRITGRNNS